MKKVVAVEAHGMKLKDYGSGVMHGTPAKMFAVVVGVILTLAGVVSLIVNPDFGSGTGIVTDRLLFMDVNGWSGVLMLLSGVVLLVGSRVAATAKKVCLAIGVVYLALTIWSLFDESILGIFPVNDMTAILYAAIGVLGVTVGVAPDKPTDA